MSPKGLSFDPRFKLAFIDFHLKQAFGSVAEVKVAILKKVYLLLVDLRIVSKCIGFL